MAEKTSLKKTFRKVIWIFLFLSLGIFFGQITLSHFGKKALEKHLGKQSNADVSIEKLSLHWRGPQECINVYFKNSSQNVVSKAEKITYSPTLFELLKFYLFSIPLPMQKIEIHQGSLCFNDWECLSGIDGKIVIEAREELVNLCIDLDSPNLTMNISGSIENQILTLNAPFSARFFLNTSSLFPIQFHDSVTLRIKEEGFSLPLSKPLKQLNISNAQINFGNIIYKNKAKTIKKFFKKEFHLQFFPFKFSLKDGIITVEKVKFLLKKDIIMFLRGAFNPFNNSIDMVLECPPNTVKKFFKIKGLPQEYVMEIPVKGKLDSFFLGKGKKEKKKSLAEVYQT